MAGEKISVFGIEKICVNPTKSFSNLSMDYLRFTPVAALREIPLNPSSKTSTQNPSFSIHQSPVTS